MKLLAGLGNPGREYSRTRHNVGWETLDAVALAQGWATDGDDFERKAKRAFEGLILDGIGPGGQKLLLLKPTTFMNLSGRSVQAAMAFYRIEAADVLIVSDDLALPCGSLRFRESGSSGGHNGLKDIERALATDRYARLRVGIDPPPPRIPGVAYVLERFTPEQRPIMDQAIAKAAQACLWWCRNGIASAMNKFNTTVRPGGDPPTANEKP
jgi:PTH1 family peptidyl-tRNA hydrolase